MEAIEFQAFPKIPRLNKEVIFTEKIDGTNAQIIVTELGSVVATSKNRIITPQNDNYDFAKWVEANKAELLKLGVGRHYGEWYGVGIGRKYGLWERRFALFNTFRWYDAYQAMLAGHENNFPKCCHVVPVLHKGDIHAAPGVMNTLEASGSIAVPGFMKPEGIVAFHTASNTLYKQTFENEEGKHHVKETRKDSI